MINKVYIDNFRSFSNFEWTPMPFTLLLGDNGSGKTTIFDVLERLRDFIVAGTATTIAFRPDTLSAWDSRPIQTFELHIKGNGGLYIYRLEVEHDDMRRHNQIRNERLHFNDAELYTYEDGKAILHYDDGSGSAEFPFDATRSALSSIAEGPKSSRVTWFRDRLERIYVLSPDPLRMVALSYDEREKPDRRLHDIASWVRHLTQERPDFSARSLNSLRESIEGFESFKVEKAGDTARILKGVFCFESSTDGPENRVFELSFDRLSEGQRNLFALYTVLYGAINKDTTIAIDEPDNYISLREIQPWLLALKDKAEEQGCQCLLISHHPEMINYLAGDCADLFYREDGGPSRVKRFEWDAEEAYRPSDIIVRGWE